MDFIYKTQILAKISGPVRRNYNSGVCPEIYTRDEIYCQYGMQGKLSWQICPYILKINAVLKSFVMKLLLAKPTSM